jgi:hypothetical protein
MRHGQHLLSQGNFREGWRYYEARWDMPDYPGNTLPFPAPRLHTLTQATGRRVLLWNEQGLGDMLLMLRFVPAIARVARQVVVAVQPALKQLVIDSLPTIEVITDGDTFEEVEYHAPLLSLPHLLRTRLATIPTSPYLRPAPDRVAAWASRLAGGRSLKVGLAWRGNPAAGFDAVRSIPLADLAPLFGLAGITFHCLANEIDPADQALLAAHPRVHAYAGGLPGLDAAAALAATMDLVITVDTAFAHLAGGLGRPVWVALIADPYWVWMTNRDDSPWYPTARLFRQSTAGDWRPVIERLRDALWHRRPSIVL